LTPEAFAAGGLYFVVEVLLTVVVREFLAWLDGALGHNEHSTFANLNFAVGAAGVVDVARKVLLVPAVYRFFVSDFEEVAAAAGTPILLFECAASVFDNACAFGDAFECKQTTPRTGTLNRKAVPSGNELCLLHCLIGQQH
jgi:hypothetical protein